MPAYRPSHVIKTYGFAANPPALDKVVFTIDHIHQGGQGMYSTFDVVKYLVSRQIPVSVFMQCTDPVNLCPADKRNARDIVNLAPHLVSLGAHSLSPGNSQLRQRNNLNLIRDAIRDISGSSLPIMSYHGQGAGPEPGIHYAGISYTRGIHSNWSTARQDNPLDTPVMSLQSVDAAFEFIRLRNLAGLSATLFVHSAELRNNSPKKRVFDTLIKEVSARKLQALPYYDAMRADYAGTTPTTPTTPTNPNTPAPCPPLNHFRNGKITQSLRKGSRDGRNGISQVAELQRFLNELGLEAGTADGIFGNHTKLAVIAYQILTGLSPDGIVGPNTRASINAYCG